MVVRQGPAPRGKGTSGRAAARGLSPPTQRRSVNSEGKAVCGGPKVGGMRVGSQAGRTRRSEDAPGAVTADLE